MKKLLFVAICLASISVACFAVSAHFPFRASLEAPQNLTVINVNQLTDSELIEIGEGKRPDVAIEFSEKTVVPLGFFLKGDLIRLVGDEVDCGQIEIMQTFYVRIGEEEFVFSQNLVEWKPFTEFATGNASIILHVRNSQPYLQFGTEMNRRG
jgi:hypothetical protein